MKCDLDYDERMSHTSVIREHYMFLLETLDSEISGGLVGQLYSDQILTAVERDDIVAEMTSFGANEKLLSVLSRSLLNSFNCFSTRSTTVGNSMSATSSPTAKV